MLYEDIRADLPGYMQFYSLYLLRRLIYVVLVYYYTDQVYILVQIFLTIILTVLYTLYLVTVKPFLDRDMNHLMVVNEFFFLAILYHLIVFTDYAQTAEIKFNAGWSMLLISMANFVWPNLTGMVQGLAPEIVEVAKTLLLPGEEKQDRSTAFFRKQRQLLI